MTWLLGWVDGFWDDEERCKLNWMNLKEEKETKGRDEGKKERGWSE